MHRKLIQPYITFLFDADQRSDVPDLIMLGHVKVLQDSSRRDDAVLQVLYAEALQVLGLKMLQELFACRSLGKHPVIQLEGKELVSEVPFEHRFLAPLEKHFLRSEIIQKLINVIKRPLGGQKLAGGYIEESDAACGFPEMDSGKEIVLFIRQHIIADSHARRHQLGNAPLH